MTKDKKMRIIYPFPMILLEFWARDEAGFSTLVRRPRVGSSEGEPKVSGAKQGMKKPLQIGGQKPGQSSGMGIYPMNFDFSSLLRLGKSHKASLFRKRKQTSSSELGMLLKRLVIGTFLSLLLEGCGFQPLLSQQKPQTTPQRFNIRIQGSGYSTYKFRRELEKQLVLTPQVNNKPYTLAITFTEGYVPIAYGTDATVARSQIQATAQYTIHDGNSQLATGTATAYSTYIFNYTEEFSTRSAQFAASERTLISLAEELAREVTLKIRSAPEKIEQPKLKTQVEKDDEW